MRDRRVNTPSAARNHEHQEGFSDSHAPKAKKLARDARVKPAPKAKTVGKKTAAAKPAAKPKKATKE